MALTSQNTKIKNYEYICTFIHICFCKKTNTCAISFFPAPQPAGGPGEPIARPAPEDPAAPHGLDRPGVSGPQSPGRPV